MEVEEIEVISHLPDKRNDYKCRIGKFLDSQMKNIESLYMKMTKSW